KKMKGMQHDVSYLNVCPDAPDVFFTVRSENNDVLTFPAHMKKLESLAEGSGLRVMAENLGGKPEIIGLPENITATGFQAVS
ncbi:hypothetical protein AAVH_42057, partial [Aphelenchoides avenae]